MDVSPETVRDIDHEQRQMRRIGDPCGGDVHEVFQAPVLFGIPEVQLNVAPQPIIVDEGRVRQVQITAEQDDMGVGLRVQVRLAALRGLIWYYALSSRSLIGLSNRLP